MNKTKNMFYTLVALVLTTGLSIVSQVQASSDESSDISVTPSAKPGELFLPSADVMADLSAVTETARENKKLVLVIMGANWCHDSRALASRTTREPLKTVINEHYETVFVDVGYLDRGKEVITSLDVPVYYATPSVLIVDPVSGQLLNAQNRHQWADADRISMKESVDYFQQMSVAEPGGLTGTEEANGSLKLLLAEIDSFEQIQADRLYEAYAVLGPMLRAYKNGDKDAFSDKLWSEVRKFRYKVPADVDALRAEAYERTSAGETNIKLEYPKYPAFSWEH